MAKRKRTHSEGVAYERVRKHDPVPPVQRKQFRPHTMDPAIIASRWPIARHGLCTAR